MFYGLFENFILDHEMNELSRLYFISILVHFYDKKCTNLLYMKLNDSLFNKLIIFIEFRQYRRANFSKIKNGQKCRIENV